MFKTESKGCSGCIYRYDPNLVVITYENLTQFSCNVSCLVCSQDYSISNINAKQLIWKNTINGLLFYFQLCVGLGKRVKEALQHVLPKSKQIHFEFQMHVLPEGDVPLQHGGMPAISFGTSCVNAQAMSVGTRSSESISGAACDIVHVPG